MINLFKNKKGVAAFFYFMIGVLFFVLGMALAPALTKTTDESRSTSQLNCSNNSISNQDKSVCYQLDAIPPVYVGIIFGFAGIIITRLLGG